MKSFSMCKHLLIGAILLLVFGLWQSAAIAGHSSGIEGEKDCVAGELSSQEAPLPAGDNVASVHHQWLGAIEGESHKRLAEVMMQSLAQSAEPNEATRRPKPYGSQAGIPSGAHPPVFMMRRALVSFPSARKIPAPSEEDAHARVCRHG